MITLTINLYMLLKIYLLGSAIGLIGAFMVVDKKFLKSKLKTFDGIKETIKALIVCILLSWLNLYWIYIEITDKLNTFFYKKNKKFIATIFACLSDRWISKNRILRLYYNGSGHYSRVRKHYYNSYRLKNKYEYFDTYDAYVEDRFVNMYTNKIFKIRWS